MLNFVRLLAFAELIGGVLWLWQAIFPHQPTAVELGEQVSRGDYTIPNSNPVSPYCGLSLICAGTISLAVTTRTTSAQPSST